MAPALSKGGHIVLTLICVKNYYCCREAAEIPKSK